MMLPQNKNVRQPVWHLYVDTAVEDSELYCYNIEGNRNSVVSQASSRMNVIRIEQNSHMAKPAAFDAFHIVDRRLWMLWEITLKVYEYV